MDTRRVIGAVAIICAVVAPLIALRVNGVIGSPSSRSATESAAQAVHVSAQRIYGNASFTPLASLSAPADLRAVLESGSLENHAGATASQIDSLREHAADFLHQRFVQPDGTRYVRWRADEGYVGRSRTYLFEFGPIGRTHIAITTSDDPMAPSDDEIVARLADVATDTMFVTAWNYGVDDRGGSGTPEGIATTPDWIVISIARVTDPMGGGRPPLGGDQALDRWYGTSAASPLQWWEPPISRDNLREADRRLVFADVGVLARFVDGSYKPIICTFAWDPHGARWWLLHMNIQNSPAQIAGISY